MSNAEQYDPGARGSVAAGKTLAWTPASRAPR
jgi:hypothetical protein